MRRTTTTIRKIRHSRIRSKIYGTAQRPRLFVFKSNKHIYGGIADDSRGKTLYSFSDTKLTKKDKVKNDINTAKKVGEELAKLAVQDGIVKAVFDRSGYNYHGKIEAFAEGARAGGLKF